MGEKIKATFIIEILGRPAEHLKESLKELVENLGKEKGINIIEKKIHEPKEIESKDKNIKEDKKLFTSFAEIDAEFENIAGLMILAFNYMPSNIEIVSPQKIEIDKFHLSEILTGVVLKMHKYDDIAKRMIIEREMFMNKLKEMGIKFSQPEKKD